MDLLKSIFSPAYNKKNGISYLFLFNFLFFSKIKNIKGKISYFLYIANFIDRKSLVGFREQLSNEDLLDLIFLMSNGRKILEKKELRNLTGLTDKGTFNKYFDKFLKEKNLQTKRKFTLQETYEILKFWQGKDKWWRLKAYTKKELSEIFDSNYERVEFFFTNNVFTTSSYKHHDFIQPAVVNEVVELLDISQQEELKKLTENHPDLNYLTFIFTLFIHHLLNVEFKKDFKEHIPESFSFFQKLKNSLTYSHLT